MLLLRMTCAARMAPPSAERSEIGKLRLPSHTTKSCSSIATVLHDAPPQSSFNASCGRRIGEFGALLLLRSAEDMASSHVQS